MKLKHAMIEVLLYLFRLFPIDNRKIVVDNFNGNGYGDNPKYIIEKILEGKEFFKIYWLVKKDTDCRQFPSEIKTVPYSSVRAIFELSTSKFWIDNVRKPYFIKKRRGQFYIQTWHGGIPLKQIEKDVEDTLSKNYLRDAKTDSDKINIILSSCKMFSGIIRKSFWYKGEILECGSPRNDILFSENTSIISKVREQLGIDRKVKLVLYAPTFRDGYHVTKAINTDKLLKTLTEKFGGEWKILLRFHPIDNESINYYDLNESVIDVSSYSDIQELLIAAQVVITDYSSLMFEFSMMKKPVFLYMYDLERYLNNRKFYFKVDELPYSNALTSEELLQNIRIFDDYEYKKKLDLFFAKIHLCETGNASEIVLERMKKESRGR